MSTENTPTPRTDKECMPGSAEQGIGSEVVYADFARQMERELAAATYVNTKTSMADILVALKKARGALVETNRFLIEEVYKETQHDFESSPEPADVISVNAAITCSSNEDVISIIDSAILELS